MVAVTEISHLAVEITARGDFGVAINTKNGGKYYYATCDLEDEAFAKMHALAKKLGTVIADE